MQRLLATAAGFLAVLVIGIASPNLSWAHYWFQRATINPTTVTARGTSTTSAPVLGPATTQFWCRTPSGQNINGPHSTLAAANAACDLPTPQQTDGPQRIVVEVATRLETVTTTTPITQTTPRTNVYGGATVKVSDAHAAMLMLSPQGGTTPGAPPPPPDTTPDAFSFVDQTGVELETTITSAAVTIQGITASITCSATGGTIDVGADNNFQSSRSVSNGNQIRARHTSSSSYSTAVNTAVTCGGVSDTFTSTTKADPEGAYTLETALDGIPFDYDPPAYPTISSNVSANTSTLASHISAGSGNNGKRITVAPGTYGALTFAANDQEIIFEDGVTAGSVDFSGSRIYLRAGGTLRNPVIGRLQFYGGASDIHLYGITVRSTSSSGVAGDNTYYTGGARVAFVSSYLDMHGYAGGYIDGYDHVLFANSILETDGTYRPNTRFMDSSYGVLVDNRVVVANDGTMTLRIHAPSVNVSNFYIARNQFEGWPGALHPDAGSGASGSISNVWYVDNTIYTGPFGNFGTVSVSNLTMTGNVMYSTSGAFPVGGNTVNSSTTPPAWNYAP